MRVLYLHQHFSTPQGSTGTRSFEMAQRLLARGHRVTMVCGSFNLAHTGLQLSPIVDGVRRGRVQGIDLIEISLPYRNADGFLKRSLTFLRFALRSFRLVLREDYDLIFATSTPLTVAVPGILARWVRHKPFIFEVRDLWPALPKAMGVIKNPVMLGLMDRLERLAYRVSDAQIGLAPGIEAGIREKNLGQPVALIPNGCDLELFRPLSERVVLPGCRADDFVAIFTGAHGQANGLHRVLEAARWLKLQPGTHRIKFVFIGDGKQKASLVEYARTHELTNCVFMAPQPKNELTRLTASAHVGLQVLENIPEFYRGTSPNKFFDYIASGIPVLNNYPGWLADLIREYNCGRVVPPERADLFGQALLDLAQDPEACRQMGVRSRRMAEEKFDREVLAADFVRFLEGTLKTAKS